MVLSNIRIPLKNGDDVGLILAVYACHIALPATIQLSDEHVAYNWFGPAEAAHLLAVKYPPEFIATIQNLQ